MDQVSIFFLIDKRLFGNRLQPAVELTDIFSLLSFSFGSENYYTTTFSYTGWVFGPYRYFNKRSPPPKKIKDFFQISKFGLISEKKNTDTINFYLSQLPTASCIPVNLCAKPLHLGHLFVVNSGRSLHLWYYHSKICVVFLVFSFLVASTAFLKNVQIFSKIFFWILFTYVSSAFILFVTSSLVHL